MNLKGLIKGTICLLGVMFVLVAWHMPAQATIINVPADHGTIQAAINAAGSYDIINVAAGTYAGFTVATANIEVRGAQYNVDPAGATTRGSESIVTSTIMITADYVTVNGFKTGYPINVGYDHAWYVNISYNISLNADGHWGAIHLHGTPSGPVYNQCDFAYIGYNTISGTTSPDWQGGGIWTVGNDDVTIEHNYILDSQYMGIFACNHVGDRNQILHNTITGSGHTPIRFWGGSQVDISYNVVDGGGFDGIWVDQAADNSTVSYNQISNIAWDGIWVEGDNSTVSYNQISYVTYAAVALRAGATGVNVHHNTITASGTGVEKHDNDITGITVNYNDIYGNSAGFGGGCTAALDVRYNYWGGAGIGAPGEGGNNGCNATADYSPWLGLPVGTSPMTWGTDDFIQDAINVASAVDIINVAAGTYYENVVIDKAITLQAGSSPVIDGGLAGACITIAANGVTIDGFELKNGSHGVFSLDTDNSTIKNCDIHDNLNTSFGCGIGIGFWTGTGTVDFDNNTIADNRIYNNDRQGIYIGWLSWPTPPTVYSNGNTISGNVIYNNGLYTLANGPDESQYGIQLCFADDNTIQDNEIYGHNAWWFGQGIYLFASYDNTVTGNNIYDNSYGINLWVDGYPRTIGNNYINCNTIAGNGFGMWNIDGSAVTVDAVHNWWGDASGPYHATTNLGGLGDEVTDYVNYSPWLVGAFSVTGNVAAYCPDPTGLLGVEIDAFEAVTGYLAGSAVTDVYGNYQIDGLTLATYTITIVTPLGYTADPDEDTVTVENVCGASVDFALTCVEITANPRSIGFWKHQVGVATGGRGNAQIDADTLCAYLDLIDYHFNINEINQVVIYEPPGSGVCAEKLGVAKDLLNLKGNVGMTDRAKQQLMALLMNVVAGNIHQMDIISVDGATVSQAITYCDNVIDTGGDHEQAKTIADLINNNQVVPAEQIPLDTPNIAYKQSGAEQLPTEFSLSQNYPNPFNAQTTIAFDLPEASQVRLTIFNVLGQVVAVPVDGYMDAGSKSVVWNADNTSSGMYLYRLQAGSFIEIRKMTLLK